VATALAGDERAADAALAAAEPVWAGNEQGPGPQRSFPADARDPWLRAAQSGPADPHISRAAKKCFEAADAALGRAGAPAPIRQAVADFTERYVLQDRCPAHDQLEEVT
jgi:glutamate--cysteine ligase